MAQLLSFSSLGVPAGLALMLRGAASETAVDPELRGLRPIGQPEAELSVEFVGISADAQRRALAAFPGGRRFSLVQPAPSRGQ